MLINDADSSISLILSLVGIGELASPPSPVPVNTPDNDVQVTGELHSCLQDDSFCQILGSRASIFLPALQGLRMDGGQEVRA